MYVRLLFLVIIFSFLNPLYGQETENSVLAADLEFRPRSELRRGFRGLPAQDSEWAFLTSQRARLNLTYERPGFLAKTSLQDIRLWGEEDTRNARGWAQFFEMYVQPDLSDTWSVRVGRQMVNYDNERLFARNNWRQAGGQHDAVRFMHRRDRFEMDFIGAFNQSENRSFGTAYTPDFEFYKVLLAHFLTTDLSDQVALTLINFGDGYQDSVDQSGTYFKWTHGGRLRYTQHNIMLTGAAYYQHGKVATGADHNAYYLEAEGEWQPTQRYRLRLGVQMLSGDADPTDKESRGFLAQYGAFHRHNGQLDFTERLVRTPQNPGLQNPYLVQDFWFGEKYQFSWENHLLATEAQRTKRAGEADVPLDKLYAWENDFHFFYQANAYTRIELAYMFLISGETVAFLPIGAGGDPGEWSQFAYLQVTWTPELFRWSPGK